MNHHPASRRPGVRRAAWARPYRDPATLLRAALLVALVFTLAMIAGGLLAGVAPAQPVPPRDPADAGGPPARSPAPVTRPAEPAAVGDPAGARLTLAQSLIYCGSAGVLLSATGLVMVIRRRRMW